MHITRISTHHPVQNDYVDMEGAGFDDVESVYVNGQPVHTIKRTDATLKFKAERDGAISIRDTNRNEVFFGGNGITIATPNSSSPKGSSAPSAPRNSGGKPTPNSSTASPNSTGNGGTAPAADPYQARAEVIKKDYDHRMEESRSSASTSSGLSRSFTAGLNVVGMTGNGIGAAGVVRETAEGVAGLVGEAGEAGTQIGQAILEGVLAPFGESASALSQVLTEWMRAGMMAASKGISGAGRVASGIAGMGVGAVSGLALSAANVASFGGTTYRDHYRKQANERGASLDSGKFRFGREAHYSSKAGQAEVERMAMVDKYGTKRGVTGRKTLHDLSGKELDKAINKQIGADFAATGLSGAMPKAFRDKRDKFYRTDPAGKAKINAGARPLTDEDKKKAEQKQINREERGERWKGRGERARQVGGSLLKTAGGVVTAGFGIAALGLNMIKGVIGGFFEMVGSGFKIVSSVISSAIRGITVIARDMFNVVSELGKKGRELDARTAMGGEKATRMSMNLGDFGIDANQMSSSIVGGIINPIRDKVSGLKDFQNDSTGALIQLAKKQQDASPYEKLQMRGMMGGGRYDAVAAVASYGPERLQRLGGFQEQFKVDPKAIRETEGDLYELTSMFKIVAQRTKALFGEALAPMLKGVLTQAAEYLKSNASAIKERIQMVAGFLVKELPVAVLKFGAVALRTFGAISTFGSRALLFVAHHLPTISKVFDFIGNGVQELARRAVSIVGGIMQSFSNFANSPLFAKIAKVFGFGNGAPSGGASNGAGASPNGTGPSNASSAQGGGAPTASNGSPNGATGGPSSNATATNANTAAPNNASQYSATQGGGIPAFLRVIGQPASWAARAGTRAAKPDVADVMDDKDARPTVDLLAGIVSLKLAFTGFTKGIPHLFRLVKSAGGIGNALRTAGTFGKNVLLKGAERAGMSWGKDVNLAKNLFTALRPALTAVGGSLTTLAGTLSAGTMSIGGAFVGAAGVLAIAAASIVATGLSIHSLWKNITTGDHTKLSDDKYIEEHGILGRATVGLSNMVGQQRAADGSWGENVLSLEERNAQRAKIGKKALTQTEYDAMVGKAKANSKTDWDRNGMGGGGTSDANVGGGAPPPATTPNGTSPTTTPATAATTNGSPAAATAATTATGAATNPADPSYRPPQPTRSNDPNALDQLGVTQGGTYRSAQQNTYGVASQFGVNFNTSGYVAGGQQMLRGGASSLLDAGNAANNMADKLENSANSLLAGHMKRAADNTGKTAAEVERFNRDKMKIDKAVVQKATYGVMDAFNDLYNKA